MNAAIALIPVSAGMYCELAGLAMAEASALELVSPIINLDWSKFSA